MKKLLSKPSKQIFGKVSLYGAENTNTGNCGCTPPNSGNCSCPVIVDQLNMFNSTCNCA